MKISIVGYGRMGKTYERALRNLGYYLTCVVDSDLQSLSRRQLCELVELTDLWIISNPTELHLRTAKVISSMKSRGRILIEKPLCGPDEYDDLHDFLNSTSSKIVMSDIYGCSGLIDRFRSFVGSSRIKKIIVEFSKNRTLDEANGRFIDRKLGIFGYEWFHILSVLREMLGTEMFDQYIGNCDSIFHCGSGRTPDTDLPYVIENCRIGGIEISLRSSIRGDVFRESCWAGLVDGMLHSRKTPEYKFNHIPVGSDQTVRYISIETEDGRKHMLHYEPFHRLVDDYKNIHLMASLNRDGTEMRSEVIRFNQLQEFLKQVMIRKNDSFPFNGYLAISQKLRDLRDRTHDPRKISNVQCMA